MRWPVKPQALILALACALGTAFATVYAKLTLEQQVEKAEVVVHALIKTVTTETRTGKPWTVYTLDPRRFVLGAASDLPQSGGAPSFAVFGNESVRLEGAPSFKAGDEVVLMLYKTAYDSPVVGFRQGAYRVSGGKIQTLDGKAVVLTLEGKTLEVTLEQFLARLDQIAKAR